MTALVLVLKKIISEDKTKYCTFYSDSKAEVIIIENEIDDVYESIYAAIIISNMQKFLRKGSGWIIDLVINHGITFSKTNPLAGTSYIRLPKELDHPGKGLINIQNIDDNECFKWSIAKYLNLANHHPPIITKPDKDFAWNLDFKGIKFAVTIRDIHKI